MDQLSGRAEDSKPYGHGFEPHIHHQIFIQEINMLQIDKPKTWVYVFIRTDLPLQQQLVQSNHSALESGIYFGDKDQNEPSSLIVIAVKNKQKLEKAMKFVEEQNIRLVPFYEPSWDYGLTSFSTEPLTQDQRVLLKRFQLWK